MTREHLIDLERPAVYCGLWLDASRHEDTHAGCDTCGWAEEGPYGQVRRKWLEHTHDPVMDIRRRFEESEDELTYRADVGYLLSLLADRDE